MGAYYTTICGSVLFAYGLFCHDYIMTASGATILLLVEIQILMWRNK